jgi:hypothetical protein
MKSAKFDYNGVEQAEVRETESGVVELVRPSGVTPFSHSFEDVVLTMERTGWTRVADTKPSLLTSLDLTMGSMHTQVQPPTNPQAEAEAAAAAEKAKEEQLAMKTAATQNITLALQQEIDDVIRLNEEKSKIEAELKKKKESVRTYMLDSGLKKLQGTHGKVVALEDAKASNSTSIFTDYHLIDIMNVLEEELLKDVTEVRVNGTKLEGLLKTGKLPSDTVKTIKGLKIHEMGTPRFKVKNS